MTSFTYLVLCAVFTASLAKNCDNLGVLIYEDLACKATSTKDGCPSNFNCKDLTSPNQCVVQGKKYNSGEAINKKSLMFTCEYGCSCSTKDKRTSVICEREVCPGSFPPFSYPHPGCYLKYDWDHCCFVEEICPPFNETITCSFEGAEYQLGERFFPKDSCSVCICQKRFSGKVEAPYCKRIECNEQFKNQDNVQKGCAPFYTPRKGEDKLCCPRSWACPNGNEVITRGGKNTNLTCKFGDKTLKVGDSLTTSVQVLEIDVYSFRKAKCECKIPPLLTCFEDKTAP